MAMPKPTPEITARFLAAVPEDVEVKPMFGCKAGFVNGNMIGGTWANTVMLRVSPEDAVELRELGGTVFDPMDSGRAMTGYYLVPESVSGPQESFELWIGRAVRHVRTLPPKVKKPKAAKKKA
jgi:TfoX/Sxy family transcriptional regulator of competence genes